MSEDDDVLFDENEPCERCGFFWTDNPQPGCPVCDLAAERAARKAAEAALAESDAVSFPVCVEHVEESCHATSRCFLCDLATERAAHAETRARLDAVREIAMSTTKPFAMIIGQVRAILDTTENVSPGAEGYESRGPGDDNGE